MLWHAVLPRHLSGLIRSASPHHHRQNPLHATWLHCSHRTVNPEHASACGEASSADPPKPQHGLSIANWLQCFGFQVESKRLSESPVRLKELTTAVVSPDSQAEPAGSARRRGPPRARAKVQSSLEAPPQARALDEILQVGR